MAHQIKLATCCYCGRRTSLKPTARGGHELACGSCGAPLHNLKAMPIAKSSKKAPKPEPIYTPTPKRKPKKRKKGLWQKALSEAWDVVEDIFD